MPGYGKIVGLLEDPLQIYITAAHNQEEMNGQKPTARRQESQ
jgi:hypothetical protein